MKKITFLLLFIFTLTGLIAQQWPNAPDRILEFFGEPLSGHFRRGLEFDSLERRVVSWDDGEVIWAGPLPFDSNVSSEQLIAIEHENGFRTFYQGVQGRPNLERTVIQGDWLGYANYVRWAFHIVDTRLSRIINPFYLLPAWEGEGDEGISKAFLTQSSRRVELINDLPLIAGKWSMAIEGRIPMGISLYWAGENLFSMRFESLSEEDGIVIMETPTPVTYNQVYDEKGRLLLSDITFTPGVGTLELRTGNARNKIRAWDLTIQAE